MPADDLSGTTLAGRYELQEQIGSGGMAVVYRALDTKVQRHVAVKVMRAELAAAIGSARFVREIGVLAKLSHPNIVGLLDTGDDHDRIFYVMPLVEGMSLRDRLDHEGSLSVAEALDIADDVCRGLTYAHGLGFVHRDIKPENVLLTVGAAMLTDFGIVRILDDAGTTQLTETGAAIGTVLYMSPEQATGEERIDARSDVYSLATVLYEMLIGETPFAGASARSVIARKATEAPRPLRTVRDTIPPALEAVILKALERHPADRHRTAAEFQQALRDATRGSGATIASASVPTSPPSSAPRGTLAAPTRRAWRTWGVVAVAVLAMAAVGTTVFRSGGAAAATGIRLAALPCFGAGDTSPVANLADGAMQSLMAELQRVRGIVPLSLGATATFQAAGLTPGRVADTLNARVIHCSIPRTGDQSRLVLELVGSDEAVAWRGEYPLGTGSPGRIALDILGAVGLEPDSVSASALAAARSTSPVADSLYTLGVHYAAVIQEPAALTRAVELFEQAIAKDSGFALAYASLAAAHQILARNHGGTFDPRDQLARARKAARAATRLQPDLAEGHVVLGSIAASDWDWETAAEEFDLALRLSPHNGMVLEWASFYWAAVGDSAAAIDLQNQQLRADPFNALHLTNICWFRSLYDKLDGALEACTRAYELNPNDLLNRNVYAWVLMLDGQMERARAIHAADSGWTDLYGRFGGSDRYGEGGGRDSVESQHIRGLYYAYAGKPDTVRLLIGALTDRYGRTSFGNIALYIAELYTLIGERDSAVRYLGRAVDDRAGYVIRLARDPSFVSLHGDPRFEALVERIGVPHRTRNPT